MQSLHSLASWGALPTTGATLTAMESSSNVTAIETTFGLVTGDHAMDIISAYRSHVEPFRENGQRPDTPVSPDRYLVGLQLIYVPETDEDIPPGLRADEPVVVIEAVLADSTHVAVTVDDDEYPRIHIDRPYNTKDLHGVTAESFDITGSATTQALHDLLAQLVGHTEDGPLCLTVVDRLAR